MANTAADSIEVEWQFDAADPERVVRWLRRGAGGGVRPLGTRELVDSYLDTADWRFMRANRSLRIRQRGDGTAEATLKSLDEQTEGPRNRIEVTQDLPATTVEALLGATGPVTSTIRAVAGRDPVRECGSVRTTRENFEIGAGRPRRPIAVLSLDRSAFGDGDAAGSPMLRVEVEVAPGVDPAEVAPWVERLVAACELTRARGSKFDHAIQHHGLARVIEPPPRPPSKRATFGEVARAAVAAQLYALDRHEPIARLGDDAEGVHDVRVATRRLRAGLALMHEAFTPDLTALREELRWVATSLGGVRDLDVLLEELDHWETSGPASRAEALAPVRGIIQRDWEAARVTLLAALDSDRYAAVIQALSALLDDAAFAPAASEGGRARAATLLHEVHRKFRRDAKRVTPVAPDDAWHQLRIRGKRLRYALEFFAPVLGRPADRALTTLKRVQDTLGEVQDAAVAGATLESIVTREVLSGSTAFALGEWAGDRGARAFALRGGFPALLEEFDHDWQQVSAVLDDPERAPRRKR